ncbi:unnamed protein product [Oikopleura dioica]|uniref:CCR4-NOT transcription complex subunit 10 n=1 Tax=Oikopleura dioica TaxID=34765 RepID=E4X2R5_OIKDI|nr:unnamed protein product [Oikopleura dioica]
MIEINEDSMSPHSNLKSAVCAFHQKKFGEVLLIVENLLELFEEEDAAGLPLEIRLKILHLAADAQLSRREPAMAVLILEKMNKIINEAENWMTDSQKRWKNRVNALYCRSYLFPTEIGESRLKQPSSKDIKTLTKSSTYLSMFAKAAFELNRNNDIKAMKILNSEPIVESRAEAAELRESCKTMYYTNQGIIFHRMHKHLLAASSFKKALEDHDAVYSQLPRSDVDAYDKKDLRATLIMNIAVSKLYQGKCEEAFRLFMKASEALYDQPSIWYRLAECCIAHKQETLKEDKQVITEIGEGCARLAIADHKTQSIEPDQPDDKPRLSYCFAYKCLQNALSYYPTTKTPTMSQDEVKVMHRMNSTILVTLGFVCLRLGKFSEAIGYTNQSIEKYPDHGYNYFANLYKAEALMELNEMSEACTVFKKAISHAQDALKWMNIDSWSQNPMNVTCPRSVQQAKVLASSNLAAAYCVDGDYNRASEQLAKVREAIPPELISPKTLLLAVYILLKKGDRQKALSILRTGNILLFN